ncbi:uncharacterized protein LOC131221170 [Magnolia sinica]|uniref:uncharacterized protein LOC131221170 n=1 Tax=Magnolia sinica TaxID=86752 RepID=UPI00265975D9|nr:uncharacterized protein LOC131221170 [Magnolia sinica]
MANESDHNIEVGGVVTTDATPCSMDAACYYERYIAKEPRQYKGMERLQYVDEIIRGDDTSCISQLRMRRNTFFRLCNLMRKKGLLNDTRMICMEEQLAMFLHTLGHNATNRAIGSRFSHSGETVSRHFQRVLNAVVGLYPDLVKPASTVTPPEILSNNYWSAYFKDCIGAIDGTHIPAFVPSHEQAKFRDRKGNVSQNVMVACSFDLKFQYVLAGWEGSASDARVLQSALTREDKLFIPNGKYYVVDAGYANVPGFLAPYQGVDYHLNEYGTERSPQDKKELFNYQHSLLHNVVKRAFGMLKARFPILKTSPLYKIETQVKVVLACCILHNFIQGVGGDVLEVEAHNAEIDEEIDLVEVDDVAQSQLLGVSQMEFNDWIMKRDDVAERMWNDIHCRPHPIDS